MVSAGSQVVIVRNPLAMYPAYERQCVAVLNASLAYWSTHNAPYNAAMSGWCTLKQILVHTQNTLEPLSLSPCLHLLVHFNAALNLEAFLMPLGMRGIMEGAKASLKQFPFPLLPSNRQVAQIIQTVCLTSKCSSRHVLTLPSPMIFSRAANVKE